MKFGALIRQRRDLLAEFSPHYMEYGILKKQINKAAAVGGDVGGEFASCFDSELEKVSTFSKSKFQELKNRVVRILRVLNTKDISSSIESVENELDAINATLVNLDSFNQLNVVAFRKISKKYDKVLNTSSQSILMARVKAENLDTQNMEGFLVALSDAYSRLRQIKAGVSVDADKWVPPQSFQRSTTKYWIENNSIVHLKSLIIRHLPMLIFGRKGNSASVAPDIMEENKLFQAEDFQQLNSIYLDNDDLLSFNTRIRGDEGAHLFRLRWYGDVNYDAPDDKEVFVERKTHHESWVSEDSVKERFAIKWKHARGWLNGTWRAEPRLQKLLTQQKISSKEAEKSIALAEESQRQVLTEKLKPIIRTAYKRTAFQLASSNSVRISLDTHMTLSNEDIPYQSTDQWCAKPSDWGPRDLVNFPYAILEIKLQEGTPPWVAELLAQPYVTQVPKFSKFQSACAIMHPAKLRVRPHWFHDDGILLQQISAETASFVMSLPVEGSEESRSVLEDLNVQFTKPDLWDEGKANLVEDPASTFRSAFTTSRPPAPEPSSLSPGKLVELDRRSPTSARRPPLPEPAVTKPVVPRIPTHQTFPIITSEAQGGVISQYQVGTVVQTHSKQTKKTFTPIPGPGPAPSPPSLSRYRSTGSATYRSIASRDSLDSMLDVQVRPRVPSFSSLPPVSITTTSQQRYQSVSPLQFNTGPSVTARSATGSSPIGQPPGKGDAAKTAVSVLDKVPMFVPVKVEPKTLFANERTFISWLNAALLLITLASGLIAVGSSFGRYTGYVMMPVGFSMIVYALVIYHMRLKMIVEKNGSYADRFGPTILVVLVVLAMVVNLIIVVSSNTGTGIYAPVVGSGCETMPTHFPPFYTPSAFTGSAELGYIFGSPFRIATVGGFRTSATMTELRLPDVTLNGAVFGPGTAPDKVYFAAGTSAKANSVIEYDLVSLSATNTFPLNDLFPGVVNGITFVPSDTSSQGGYFYISDTAGTVTKLELPIVSGNTVHAEETIDLRTYFPATGSTNITGKSNVRALSYDSATNNLYMLMNEANQMVVVDATSGVLVKSMTLPGTANNWVGFVPPSTATATGDYLFAQAHPPAVWKFTVTDSGFPGCSQVRIN